MRNLAVAILSIILAAGSVGQISPQFLYSIPLDGSSNGLHMWGPTPGAEGLGPGFIAANSRGDLLIADPDPPRSDRLKLFDRTGFLVRTLEQPPDVDDTMVFGLALCNDRSSYVLEGTNDGMCDWYSPEGTLGWRKVIRGRSAQSRPGDPWLARSDNALIAGFLSEADSPVVVRPTGDLEWLNHNGIAGPDPHGPALMPIKGELGAFIVQDHSGASRRISLQEVPAPFNPRFAQTHLHPRGFITRTHAVPAKVQSVLKAGNLLNLDMITVRYSPTGRVLATLRWPAPPIAASNSAYAFDPDGNLYCLVYDWHRVHVVRFALSEVDEGFVAVRLVPSLTIDGRRYTPLVESAEATARMAVWNAKSKTAKVGTRTLVAGQNLRIVRGAPWISKVGAERLGLNLDWHPKGFYAYVSRWKRTAPWFR